MLRLMSDEESIFIQQVLMIKGLFVKELESEGKVTLERLFQSLISFICISRTTVGNTFIFWIRISFFWNYFSGTVSLIL